MEASIVTTLSLILNFILECCATHSFIVFPTSTTAMEGQNVTLRCTITKNTSETVSWSSSNSLALLSRGQTILTQALVSSSQYDRLSISGNSDLGEYNLNFQNVQAEDAGQYSCGYFSLLQRQAIFSPKAVLSVILPPVCEHFPQNLDLRPTPGTQIQMVCTSQNNRPNTDLTWLRNGQLLRGASSIQTERSNAISYLLTEDDYDQPFTCIENMSPLSYVPNCFITPLRQTTKPVHIASFLEIATNGNISHLTCLTNQSLESFTYRWLVDSNLTPTTTNMFSFGPVSSGDNGTIITCEVHRGGELYGTDDIVIIITSGTERVHVSGPTILNTITTKPEVFSYQPHFMGRTTVLYDDSYFTIYAGDEVETFTLNATEDYLDIRFIVLSAVLFILIFFICLAIKLVRCKEIKNTFRNSQILNTSSNVEMRDPSNFAMTRHDSPPVKGSTEMVYASRIYNSHPGSDESPEDYVPMAGSTEMVYNRQIYDCSQHFYHQTSNLEDDPAHYHSIE